MDLTQKNPTSSPRSQAGAESISPERVPVTVLCGFLGAGKTTLLRHLLSQSETAGNDGKRAKWAAIVNDLATVNIDGALLTNDHEARLALGLDDTTEVLELGNGCVCCSGAEDLGEAIARLALSARFEHIWVETTGVADPRGVANLFTRKNPFGRALSDHAQLATLVTVIDVVALAEIAAEAAALGGTKGRVLVSSGERPVFELMVEQIESADLVILNQCDRATDTTGEIARAKCLVEGLNARAEIVSSEHGQVAVELFTGRIRFNPAVTLASARWIRELNRAAIAPGTGALASETRVSPRPARSGGTRGEDSESYHKAKYGISSFVYRARTAFDAERLRALFSDGLPGILRAKGFFWTTVSPDEMGFVSLAGGVVRWETLSVWWAARIAAGRATMAERPASVVAHWKEPHGDRRQEIVLIGVRLNEAALKAALDKCLKELDC